MTRIDHDPSRAGPAVHTEAVAALTQHPRPRDSSYVVYGDALDAPEVYVHRRVTEDVRSAALNVTPREMFGALLGRPCHDAYGGYVVVENAIAAIADEHLGAHSSGHFAKSHRASILRRAAQRHPALDLVGWWHARAPGAPRRTSLDIDERSLVPLAYRVVIAVDVERLSDGTHDAGLLREPFGVYVGPSSAVLARRG